MIVGWNIFAWVAVLTIVLAVSGAAVALYRKEYSGVAMWFTLAAILVLGAFIVMLGVTLGRPPMRTMGETRLWYSFFMLVAGAITYARWRYRWVLSFSTLMATVFMIINIVRPEIHDHTLMPALQSVWFIPHVAVYMFSYALLGCATLLAIYQFFTRDDIYPAIDRLVYAGVAFFTIGMLTGALWAKEAWGAVGCSNMDALYVVGALAHDGQNRPPTQWSYTDNRFLGIADVLVWSKLPTHGNRKCTYL